MEAGDTARELYRQRVEKLEEDVNNIFTMEDSPLVVLHLICDSPDGSKFNSTDQIPSPPLPSDRQALGVNRTPYRDGTAVRENANGGSIKKYSYFDENGWVEVGDTTFNQEKFPSERLKDFAWDLVKDGFENFKDSNLTTPYHLYVTLYDLGNTHVAVKPEDQQTKIASNNVGGMILEFSQIKQNSRTQIRNSIDTIWQK